MGWSIRQLRTDADVWGLVDQFGNTATHGTESEMKTALAQKQRPDQAISKPIGAGHNYELGSPVWVLYYQDFWVAVGVEQGSWQTLEGTYLFGDSQRIVYELSVRSTPERFGGDWPANDGSLIRIVSRDRVFPTRELAEAAKTNRPRPVVQGQWTPASR